MDDVMINKTRDKVERFFGKGCLDNKNCFLCQKRYEDNCQDVVPCRKFKLAYTWRFMKVCHRVGGRGTNCPVTKLSMEVYEGKMDVKVAKLKAMVADTCYDNPKDLDHCVAYSFLSWFEAHKGRKIFKTEQGAWTDFVIGK